MTLLEGEGTTPPSDTSDAALTDGADLGATCMALAGRTQAALKRRGYSHHAAEDATQTAALQAVRVKPEYTDADDLGGWYFTTSHNAARSQRRADDRATAVGLALPKQPTADTTEDRALLRLRLDEVLETIGTLPERDQIAFQYAMRGEVPHATAADRGAWYQQLRRARQRLLAALGGSAVFAWLSGFLRRDPLAATPVIVAAMSVAATLAVVIAGPDSQRRPEVVEEPSVVLLSPDDIDRRSWERAVETVGTSSAAPLQAISAPAESRPASQRPRPVIPLPNAKQELPDGTVIAVRDREEDEPTLCLEAPVVGEMCTPI